MGVGGVGGAGVERKYTVGHAVVVATTLRRSLDDEGRPENEIER